MADHKKILVLSSTFPRWRADTGPGFVFDLARNYVRRGFKVDVIAPHAFKAKIREEMGGVEIYRYRYFFERLQTLAYDGGIAARLKANKFNYLLIPWLFIFQALAIVRRIKEERYDLIHAHWLLPQALVCVLVMKYIVKQGVPILCTSHGGDLYAFNGTIMRRLKRWVIKNCTHLCVVSETMKNDCIALGLASDRISVLPMGVRIIFVGRFVEKKGISVLIEAIRQVRLVVPLVELILLGDGPLKKTIKAEVNRLELHAHVKIYDGIANEKLPAHYSSANIAVVPSIIDAQGDREGLGLVTIEASGCECAVVASALGPVKEIIEQGKTGLLFAPGHADELARCLIKLLQDIELSRSLAQAGRAKVKKTFDWQIVSENYVRLIDAICCAE